MVQSHGAGTPSRPRPTTTTSMDDSSTAKQLATRSPPPIDLNPPSMPGASYATVAKSSPDRYRRNHRRAETTGGLTSNPPQSNSTMPSGSGMATVGHLYTHPSQTSSTPSLSTYPSYRGAPSPNAHTPHEHNVSAQPRLASKDDMNVQQRQSASELAKRYRRRSISSLEAKEYALPLSEVPPQPLRGKSYAAMLASPAPSERKENRGPNNLPERPTSAHDRKESNESGNSVPSGAKSFPVCTSSSHMVQELSSGGKPTGSSGHHTDTPLQMKRGPDIAAVASAAQQVAPIAKSEAKVVNVPPRGSSDANKRLAPPSPLSRPVPMSPEHPSNKDSSANPDQPRATAPGPTPAPSTHVGIPESPAAQQLAALNKKESKKEGKSSRLRRAFSFGSAAELRKASAENNAAATRERNKLQKNQYADEEEAQQAAIAQQQEASGLGEGIYSGQGQFFTGSTDNLSISSTASSASVMIRKMGKGMKKGSRSLVGLFRPKSVVGVPAASSAVPETSMAQVSMVTVEAEREKVNVNVDPHDQAGGGTGFPKLERNSLDAANMTHDHTLHTASERDGLSRRSIVGGERERAEVLAAVKKGILKRTDSGSSSPQVRPIDAKAVNSSLPHIPWVNDSPSSSTPSTPADDATARGHGKTDSVHIEGEDYFLSMQNYASGQSASMPGTPRGTPRNISFSPRIQFHDTWPSGEYDRRGEIATCNRLTPMLAQQIKEELNTFKMEMEVHAESKVNTHFF
ncbi:MAG: hypothetical protein Q9163_002458 [Psora crenata]